MSSKGIRVQPSTLAICTCSTLLVICALLIVSLLVFPFPAFAQTSESVEQANRIVKEIAAQNPTHWIIWLLLGHAVVFAAIVRWLLVERKQARESHVAEMEKERQASSQARAELISYMRDTHEKDSGVHKEMIAVQARTLVVIERCTTLMETIEFDVKRST